MIKTLISSFVKMDPLVPRFKYRTDTHTHTQTACGSLTGSRLRKIISPDFLCVAGCWLITSPLTQDPVDPHLRRRRPRRLLPPKDRESGIQEYVNGSSGTNIVWPWVGVSVWALLFRLQTGLTAQCPAR